MDVILAEVVRVGRFVSGTIHVLWLRLTPSPYSTADNYWHKKHNDDGVNSAGNNEDRGYFSLLVGPSLRRRKWSDSPNPSQYDDAVEEEEPWRISGPGGRPLRGRQRAPPVQGTLPHSSW